ncbi:MAG: hypothetical protein ACRC42_01535 [Mycoplasma sp.]
MTRKHKPKVFKNYQEKYKFHNEVYLRNDKIQRIIENIKHDENAPDNEIARTMRMPGSRKLPKHSYHQPEVTRERRVQDDWWRNNMHDYINRVEQNGIRDANTYNNRYKQKSTDNIFGDVQPNDYSQKLAIHKEVTIDKGQRRWWAFTQARKNLFRKNDN